MTAPIAPQPKLAADGSSTTASNAVDRRAKVVHAASNYVPLTAEGLLLFCQSQLQELDKQIDKNMKGQEGLVALQKDVSDLQNALKACSQNGKEDDNTMDSEEKFNELKGQMEVAIEHAKAAGDTTLANSLEDVKTRFVAGNDATVWEAEIKDMCGMLDTAMSTCRTGAEMKMIELQSLISKRATGLQLVTSMMNSVNESAKTIAGNVGR